MKKEYVKPEMEILIVETAALLAGSGDEYEPGHHGHETACEHGSHAWFCDD